MALHIWIHVLLSYITATAVMFTENCKMKSKFS